MTDIKLIAIKERFEDNKEFEDDPVCMENLEMSVLYYAKVGYSPPWIGYFASSNNSFVGSAGFKGRPLNGKVEIAYSTFSDFQKMGIGTELCRQLVAIARATDSSVKITARTLMEENHSVKILRKNGFKWLGVVVDPDDGEVWEWEHEN